MKKTSLFVSIFVAGAVATAAGFALFNEYRKRDQMVVTADQTNILNFLVAAQFTTQKIVELDVLEPNTTFVLRTRAGDVCGGDVAKQVVGCKNALGFDGLMIPDAATVATMAGALTAKASIPLLDEFKKRVATPITPEVKAILDFFTLNKYQSSDVEELELMDPPTSFVIRNRNGDICFGDLTQSILRCKNEMGITGVTFTGDSD